MGGRNEEKARQALEAMRKLGFGRKQATPVLKRLFRLFDRQWQPIEDDSYRALVEAILDDQPQSQQSQQSPQSQSPQQQQPNAAGGGPANDGCTSGSGGQSRGIMMDAEFQHPAFFPKDPKPEPPEPVDMDASACRDVQSGLILRSRNPNRNALPPTDTNPHHISGDKNRAILHHTRNAAVSQQEPTSSSTLINGTGSQVQEIDVASSPGGEVKLSLKCTAHPSNLNMPPHNMQAVYKILEDKYLSSDKLLPPDLSIPGLLAEVCQSVVQLGTQHYTMEHTTQSHTAGNASTSKGVETPGNASTSKGVETLGNASTSKGVETLGNASTSKGVEALGNASTSKGVETLGNASTSKDVETLGNATTSKGVVEGGPATSTPAPQQHSRTTHDVHDISKGEEHVKIPIANESGRGKCPPSFSYIPGNEVFQNAIVNISLAQIGAQDCCADCFGDCLSAPVPCACARVTGGEYAYTPGGLVKPEFIDKCVSMNRFPEAHHKVFCKTCPLERSRDKASPEPCRGHLVRKFIKECWSKCGCSMRCGNRVVQRGIRFNLQVFPTGNGRGWGLRTQNALPKGAFVCEYVGEILTCAEVHERAVENMKNARYTHTVALDAGWPSGGSLKDEEALCLDGTFYGNVGRFINHRCRDANLAMVPVQVETPDRHYYHVAFFTSRKVEALEELTWDYGIDFEEESERGPVKVFECLCGSKYCRGSRHLRNGNGNGKKRCRD